MANINNTFHHKLFIYILFFSPLPFEGRRSTMIRREAFWHLREKNVLFIMIYFIKWFMVSRLLLFSSINTSKCWNNYDRELSHVVQCGDTSPRLKNYDGDNKSNAKSIKHLEWAEIIHKNAKENFFLKKKQ